MDSVQSKYKRRVRIANDEATRNYWNPRFEPLGFELPPGRIPSNRQGTALRIPSAAMSMVIKRLLDSGETVGNLAARARVHERRISLIRDQGHRYTTLDVADAIITAMDLTDLWYTELRPCYDFAFRGCE